MKHHYFSVVIFISFLVSPVQAQEYRTWTGSNGKTIEAEFLRFDEESQIVHIRLINGKNQKVKIDLFSQPDQDFVRNYGNTDNPFGESEINSLANFYKRTATQAELNKLVLEAEKLAEKINSPAAFAHLIVIQTFGGHENKVKQTFEKGLQLENGGFLMGKAIFEVGMVDLAEKVLDEMEKNSKVPVYIDSLFTLAPLYLKHDRDKAASLLKKALTMLDAEPNLKKDKFWTNKVIDCHVRMGNINAALAAALKVEAKDHAVQFSIGKCYLENGKYDDAIELFDAAEDGTTTSMRLADLWIEKGKPEKARKLLNRFDNSGYKTIVLRFLAIDELKNENTQEALRLIEEALSNSEELYINISNLYELFLLTDLLNVLGEGNKVKNAYKKIYDYIERAPDSNMKHALKCELAIYTKLQGEDKAYRDMINDLPRLTSSPELVWIFWNSALNMLKLAGENDKHEEYMTKLKRMGLTEKDEKRRKILVDIYKRNENDKHWEIFLLGDNYVRRLGFNQISRMEAPAVQWVQIGAVAGVGWTKKGPE